jgi:protein-S-isoprenylcysteine O-methyltransferase Ste14
VLAAADYFRPFFDDPPAFVLIITIWLYGAGLGIKLIRGRKKNGAAGVLPTEAFERTIWPVWFPLLVAWVLMPGLAVKRRHPWLVISQDVLQDPGWWAVRWIAALTAVLSLILVMWCWRHMGRSWRVGVMPGARSALVTGGPYRCIRHPIYAFSMLLVLCSVVIVPTAAMILVALPHFVFMTLKARREEQVLLRIYGDAYAEYCERTGRFFPPLMSRRWRLCSR